MQIGSTLETIKAAAEARKKTMTMGGGRTRSTRHDETDEVDELLDFVTWSPDPNYLFIKPA